MIAATTIGQGDRSLMDKVTGPVPDPVPRGHAYLTNQNLLPFKTGLYHLAVQRPKIDMVPVWIENLNRVMPKGEIISVPIMCKAIFGSPLRLAPDETKDDFLARSRDALLALHPNPAEAGDGSGEWRSVDGAPGPPAVCWS
ncbi:hypothetical protein [Paracoccus sp. MKU1]|uniref:hypothetical protein n=1 Tax=Paracoccus sp. MKU1 TaxID=1745182 RepID=UPI000AEF2F17|nr:hypothetical protein [Paracoccus sp. MKU1]